MKKLYLAMVIAAIMLVLSACSNEGSATESSDSSGESAAPGEGSEKVGFIFVGTKDDYGYNQAAYDGSVAVEEAFPDMEILRSENVPETAEAERVMEEMIRNGAKVIFPTSYGHLEPAMNVAERHPDVAFFHQGGLKNAENLGTYFGNIWQAAYLSGVAAGSVSESGNLGYVVSFPIPQVLLNVNAFTLGAQSVNPDATTTVAFTGSWCDPGQQASSVNSLAEQGVDVISQHQDCTKTVIETADRLDIKSVGYHADASTLAPETWVTGAIWNWGDLFVDMTTTAIEGNFKGSEYDGIYRGGLSEGVVELAPFGNQVPDDVKTLVEEEKAAIESGEFHPFAGPIKSQNGDVKIEEGVTPTTDELEAVDYFVEGVIGNISE
ncbi:BMP family ABC transporter substrate-binding protein [Gracilibacillus oryzae]|uniref:BMP family ABC transporter substrate-binding protein n=1 Tax=Gracilibacillus oryzae TaxID=1672701 RepID=A0A7C8L6N3_9BACI|nr:BMP family ABC transporter substrate-binding protein [Gracilibacillus oryzae]KAB8132923.1 BMP family ABC transporter substrate-binding protein [Gracilibacillus oryzae]